MEASSAPFRRMLDREVLDVDPKVSDEPRYVREYSRPVGDVEAPLEQPARYHLASHASPGIAGRREGGAKVGRAPILQGLVETKKALDKIFQLVRDCFRVLEADLHPEIR